MNKSSPCCNLDSRSMDFYESVVEGLKKVLLAFVKAKCDMLWAARVRQQTVAVFFNKAFQPTYFFKK